ncbi:hypothetical protein [Halanaerobium congolense]|uniref:Uncharacterized protein n=1 Tax=Halanaerobium congolense TaxID=54121 RepID=A0A1G6MPE4_9FIRM|nr:hypothetical protein [Halanaerobium congolense]SDC57097.1 hypothetical protein SAMN04488597_10915 [Halanaerobium congolense]
MDMIVNKNNSKSTDLKYIFELQKSNYNEIKMSTIYGLKLDKYFIKSLYNVFRRD